MSRIGHAAVVASILSTVIEARSEPSGLPPPSPELTQPAPRVSGSKGMHPRIVLMNREQRPVATSGGFVSFQHTCGACHDATWIGQHGYHFRVGVDERQGLGRAASGRPWDFGSGLFGRWDPMDGYDAILPAGDPTPAAVDGWVERNRLRLAGGGPAALGASARDFEPNCGLCHVRGAGIRRDGVSPFAAFSTSTLEPLGIVELKQAAGEVSTKRLDEAMRLSVAGGLEIRWNRDAFAPDGTVDPRRFIIEAPSSEACGTCHGVVKAGQPELRDWSPAARLTETTGQVFSPSRISESGLNVAAREQLARPWDVHASRLLRCTSCHFSPNNPSAALRNASQLPEHLKHEVRKLPLGEFLLRPSHELAKGYSSQGTVAPQLDGTMRRCEDCHDALRVHRWLPKAERHLQQIGCESCHLDALHAPARQVTDYSLVDEAGRPRVEYRGIEGSMANASTYLPTHRPLLLRRKDADHSKKLLPYNIVTSFYWVIDDPKGARPASVDLLKRAFYEDARARDELLRLLDDDHDGRISDGERRLSTAERVAAARGLLERAGARNPRLVGEMQPYGIHHGMAEARFAVRDCSTCHAAASRLTEHYRISEFAPFGVLPKVLADSNVEEAFSIVGSKEGGLWLVPSESAAKLHVFGLSRRRWLDVTGLSLVALVLLGALGHGAMRYRASRKRGKS